LCLPSDTSESHLEYVELWQAKFQLYTSKRGMTCVIQAIKEVLITISICGTVNHGEIHLSQLEAFDVAV